MVQLDRTKIECTIRGNCWFLTDFATSIHAKHLSTVLSRLTSSCPHTCPSVAGYPREVDDQNQNLAVRHVQKMRVQLPAIPNRCKHFFRHAQKKNNSPLLSHIPLSLSLHDKNDEKRANYFPEEQIAEIYSPTCVRARNSRFPRQSLKKPTSFFSIGVMLTSCMSARSVGRRTPCWAGRGCTHDRASEVYRGLVPKG